jgi:Kringle domain
MCGSFDWNQQDYRGPINVTKSGLNCQPWAEQVPYVHYHLPALLPEANLICNACRNPTGDRRAWCYTTSPNVIWEHCDVAQQMRREQRASYVAAKKAKKHYRGTISVKYRAGVARTGHLTFPTVKTSGAKENFRPCQRTIAGIQTAN